MSSILPCSVLVPGRCAKRRIPSFVIMFLRREGDDGELRVDSLNKHRYSLFFRLRGAVCYLSAGQDGEGGGQDRSNATGMWSWYHRRSSSVLVLLRATERLLSISGELLRKDKEGRFVGTCTQN